MPPATLEAAHTDNAVEWAWAVNAASSVLGSTSAMVIAVQFGFNFTLVLGAVAYLLALVLTRHFPRNRAESGGDNLLSSMRLRGLWHELLGSAKQLRRGIQRPPKK